MLIKYSKKKKKRPQALSPISVCSMQAQVVIATGISEMIPVAVSKRIQYPINITQRGSVFLQRFF